ncbi:hypothetical protein EPJ64_05570 [Brachyspira aalborgi]|uniref:Uncharacterized protein n=1 Tax=Brachyspira aalborgi TaxID=29522 RepID=A0AB38Q077_9SPIR|nr:hypothetical protein [Brachyspira aalborgi]TXJ15681.1 hypothetical protein EPJ77_05420 [Brachyspira aalborgi]TXJ18955.1 hypothetical protein EPJ64_05570 [Brachyspira aalborgi]TXJ25071.1 hypothetical protein EPJ73_06250 [Brachyspira aalborgi]TXJ47087.1 hypothetical protein EPJ75_10220 [Brachyspira aalborgi]
MSYFIELLRKAWEFIKKIFLKIVNFVTNIVSFFKDPQRLKKLQEDKNRIAISIKENLDNGKFNVVNCLYDKTTEEIVDMETDALGIDAESLDEETKQHFGDKDIIVLN